jgi:hypothetical protein
MTRKSTRKPAARKKKAKGKPRPLCPKHKKFLKADGSCTPCQREGETPVETPVLLDDELLISADEITVPVDVPPDEPESPQVDEPPADASDTEPAIEPEVGEIRPGSLLPQLHGGSIRWGNPGNRGGGRHPEPVRQRLREILQQPGGGVDLIEEAIARTAVDLVPIKVSGGERVEMVAGKAVKLANPELVQLVEVPTPVRTALVAADVALRAAEGMVAPEKPGLTKRRILEVRMVAE